MIEDFDITMTATLRPELIERTLRSHIKYLFRECIRKARLIINIDMTGEKDKNLKVKKMEEILCFLEHYPFRSLSFRIGEPANFATAFFWCWDQAKTKYVFHLEEDWEMKQRVSFEKMVGLFDRDQSLVHLRLSSFVSTSESCKNWNKFTHWNGKYFEVAPEDKCVIGWAGHPSLNRLSFMQQALSYANRRSNPEKQIKGRRGVHPINDLLDRSRFGVFTPQNSKKVIEDIGREWMIQNGWAKRGNKAFFTEWEETNGR